MIPLCNVDGVASVLFTKRSGTLRAHKNEVCFPGGKVSVSRVAIMSIVMRVCANVCPVRALRIVRCTRSRHSALLLRSSCNINDLTCCGRPVISVSVAHGSRSYPNTAIVVNILWKTSMFGFVPSRAGGHRSGPTHHPDGPERDGGRDWDPGVFGKASSGE